MKTIYEYLNDIQEILDDALNKLSPKEFAMVLDGLDIMLSDYD